MSRPRPFDEAVETAAGALTELARARGESGPLLVAVDGFGGCGKTTFARVLAERLERAGLLTAIVSSDDFFRPRGERGPDGETGALHDWRRLRAELLEPLSAGRTARYRAVDWDGGQAALREDETVVDPPRVAIVEGTYCAREELADLIDWSAWIDCPESRRVTRGLGRDGLAAASRWLWEWSAAEKRHAAAQPTWTRCDLVVDGSGPPPMGVDATSPARGRPASHPTRGPRARAGRVVGLDAAGP